MQNDFDLSDGLWLSVSGIAARLGLTRQAVSKRAVQLEEAGKLVSRPGKGGTKEINLAQYMIATKALGNPAREHAAVTRRQADEEIALGDSRFRDHTAREKQFKADLAEIEVRTKLGELVEVTRLAAVVSEAAEIIVAVLERAPQQADSIAAAVAKDGAAGARAVVKQMVRGQRVAIADSLRKVVASINGEATKGDARFAEDDARAVILWGDLDPTG